MSDLDPRWEWMEFRRMGDAHPTYRKVRCNHLEVVPVESGGETVAHLCLTCDQQLPAEWVDVYAESRELRRAIQNLRSRA